MQMLAKFYAVTLRGPVFDRAKNIRPFWNEWARGERRECRRNLPMDHSGTDSAGGR